MFSMIRRKENGMASETVVSGEAKAHFDMPTVWWLSMWGAAALVALAATTLAAVSESGAQRFQLAISIIFGPTTAPAAVAKIPPQPASEAIKVTEALRLIAADRDRLDARLATLEHTLEDVTASTKRQTEKPAADQATRQASQPTPPPISAPATMTAVTSPANDSPQGPSVPLPPERLASVEASAPKIAAPPPKPDIGIDLGSASTPQALRAHWSAIKANYGPLLGTLRPMMTMREHKPGMANYRLILGPIPDVHAAGQLCAKLVAARTACRPTTFISQTAALL
jgi:hypothetical protein